MNANTLNQENPLKALELAASHEAQEQFMEALELRLWFHHNAVLFDPSLVGIRASYALSDWVALGNRYQPALVALESEAGTQLEVLLGSAPTARALDDFSAICLALGTPERTVSLLQRVVATHPTFVRENIQSLGLDFLQARSFQQFEEMGGSLLDCVRSHTHSQMELALIGATNGGTKVRRYVDLVLYDRLAELFSQLREYVRSRVSQPNGDGGPLGLNH
jgi:hypothetical protein